MPPRVNVQTFNVQCPQRKKLTVVAQRSSSAKLQCSETKPTGLRAYGYTKVQRMTGAARLRALRAAVRAQGKPVVVNWLRRLETFNKTLHPDLSRLFRADRLALR